MTLAGKGCIGMNDWLAGEVSGGWVGVGGAGGNAEGGFVEVGTGSGLNEAAASNLGTANYGSITADSSATGGDGGDESAVHVPSAGTASSPPRYSEA